EDRIADNQYSALYSSRRNSKHSSGRSSGYSSSSSSRSTQRAATTTATPSSPTIDTSPIQIQSPSDNCCLSSSPNAIPLQTSLPYPTYSNSCVWSDELDADDYTGFGVFAPDIFDDFETSSILSASQNQRGRGDDFEFDGVGLVDRAVHIASNVKDIVHWCSSMVFNGQV